MPVERLHPDMSLGQATVRFGSITCHSSSTTSVISHSSVERPLSETSPYRSFCPTRAVGLPAFTRTNTTLAEYLSLALESADQTVDVTKHEQVADLGALASAVTVRRLRGRARVGP